MSDGNKPTTWENIRYALLSIAVRLHNLTKIENSALYPRSGKKAPYNIADILEGIAENLPCTAERMNARAALKSIKDNLSALITQPLTSEELLTTLSGQILILAENHANDAVFYPSLLKEACRDLLRNTALDSYKPAFSHLEQHLGPRQILTGESLFAGEALFTEEPSMTELFASKILCELLEEAPISLTSAQRTILSTMILSTARIIHEKQNIEKLHNNLSSAIDSTQQSSDSFAPDENNILSILREAQQYRRE